MGVALHQLLQQRTYWPSFCSSTVAGGAKQRINLCFPVRASIITAYQEHYAAPATETGDKALRVALRGDESLEPDATHRRWMHN